MRPGTLASRHRSARRRPSVSSPELAIAAARYLQRDVRFDSKDQRQRTQSRRYSLYGILDSRGAAVRLRIATRYPLRYGSSSIRPERSSAQCSSDNCRAARICGSNYLNRETVFVNNSCSRSRPSTLRDSRPRPDPDSRPQWRNELAAAREVAVRRGTEPAGGRGDLGDGDRRPSSASFIPLANNNRSVLPRVPQPGPALAP